MALTDKLTAIAEAIRAKTGKSDSLTLDQMPTEIMGITTGGGGSSADVRYVTFMNGTEVLYKKPVAVGDDCVDVLKKGLIETPTKASDVQYNYTYYGWGASDGGAANANILKNITEDKTVYAIFTATVRYYTITYLDSDGVTVLKTEQVAYGAVPSYAPVKEGASFDGWTPTPVAVTGNASYTAKWLEMITFAKGSWADIARISEAGEARNYFAIGDTKDVTFDGYTITFEIVGFDHDDLADGSGKAGISMIAKQVTNTTIDVKSTWYNDNWGSACVANEVMALKSKFTDTGLVDAMKLVKKQVDTTSSTGSQPIETIDVDLWLPSITELVVRSHIESSSNYNDSWTSVLGTTYEKFLTKYDLRRQNPGPGYKTAQTFITRTQYRNGSSGFVTVATYSAQRTGSVSSGTAFYLLFGFCV